MRASDIVAVINKITSWSFPLEAKTIGAENDGAKLDVVLDLVARKAKSDWIYDIIYTRLFNSAVLPTISAVSLESTSFARFENEVCFYESELFFVRADYSANKSAAINLGKISPQDYVGLRFIVNELLSLSSSPLRPVCVHGLYDYLSRIHFDSERDIWEECERVSKVLNAMTTETDGDDDSQALAWNTSAWCSVRLPPARLRAPRVLTSSSESMALLDDVLKRNGSKVLVPRVAHRH